jgi:hypothetical protein
MRAAPRFLCACVGMSFVNSISARKHSRRQIGGPAQPLRAGVGERKWVGGGMRVGVSDSCRSLLSAGECFLVVIIVALRGAKLNSLTPLGSVVLPLLKITMQRTSLAALCNEILCSKRLRGSPVTERTNIRCERPFATSSPLQLPAWCC